MKKIYLFVILFFLSLGVYAQTSTFGYSGAIQSYTVPAGVTTISIAANGAQGGNQTSDPAPGGAGAMLYGNFAVTPGHVLNILVGEQPPAALNDGGGGGGSFVWDVTAGNVLLIAAGGGGGAGVYEFSDNGIDAVVTANGTNGGGAIYGGGGVGGNGGTVLIGTCDSNFGAGGAGWLSNGAVGNNMFSCTIAGGGSTPLSGGAGGAYGGTSGDNGRGGFGGGGGSQGQCSYSGGGGGGGYSGGGGGDYDCIDGAAEPGGGGGSYNGGSGQSNSVGNTGNGGVTICAFPVAGSVTGIDTFCVGSGTDLADVTGAPGGTWSSSNATVAAIGSTGIVSAVAVGVDTITYTTPNNGCGVSNATATIAVTSLPLISSGSTVTICNGTSTPLTATGGAVYSWSPASGLSCTNCSNPTASPTSSTTYTVTGSTIAAMVYNQSFTNGVASTTQCTAWQSFLSSLTNSYSYTGFTMRGSQNTTGISCTDPVVAAAVANALKTGTAYTGSSDGQTWTVSIGGCTVSGCGGLYIELANQGACSCAMGYSVRPAINNLNWGGIGGLTCDAPSQTIEVDFYYAACSNTATVTVSVNQLPAMYDVTGSGSYCAGGSGRHIGLDTSNFGVNYQLYGSVSTIGTPIPGTDTVLDFGSDTADTYGVIATDTTTGCTDTMNGSAIVTPITVVVPSVSITMNTPDTICAGTTTTFTAWAVNGGGTPLYQWTVNGTDVGTDSTAYWYNPADSDDIAVTLISSQICAIPDTVSDTVLMHVFPYETPGVGIAATPSDVVCRGTSVTMVAHPTYGGPSPYFIWIKDSVVVSTSPTYTFTPIDSDDVYCVMESDYLCRILDTLGLPAFSNAVYIAVEAPIVPSVTITGHPGIIVEHGKPDTLDATVTNGGLAPAYQWYINAIPVTGATSSVFYIDSFVNHDSVSVYVTREDACRLPTINSVVILVANVGVPELAAGNNLALMPNPNNGTFTIKGTLGSATDEALRLDITNMLGQSVYSNKVFAKSGEVNELIELNSNIAAGTYILNLHSLNGDNVFRFTVTR